MLGASSTRSDYDRLASVYLAVAAAVFVVVALALVVVAVRSRDRPDRRPAARLTAPRLELGYVGVLVVVAGVLLWRSFVALPADEPIAAEAATPQGTPALTIRVVASQWNWRFTYPGGVVQTGDGRERPAVLVVPEDRTVRLALTSGDVAHAFWIPALRLKYDAVPGYTNSFDASFPARLDYTTARCSEFCGTYHDEMRFQVRVLAPARFAAWLRRRSGA